MEVPDRSSFSMSLTPYHAQSQPGNVHTGSNSLMPNSLALFDLKIKREQFEKVIDGLEGVIALASLCGNGNTNTVFKKQITGLPFSIACTQDVDSLSVSILTKNKIARGTHSSVRMAWGIQSQVKEIFRSAAKIHVHDSEIEINKLLAGRKEFVATTRIVEYKGPVSEQELFEGAMNRPLNKDALNGDPDTAEEKEWVPKVGFFLEYMSCALDTYLSKRNVQPKPLLQIFKGILKNISVLNNEFKIVHFDIKLDNILVQDEMKRQIVTKIADFGLSNYIGQPIKIYLDPDAITMEDGAHYLQPEVINLRDPDTGFINYPAHPSADMWRFGVMLVQTLGGEEAQEQWRDLVHKMFQTTYKSIESREMLVADFLGQLTLKIKLGYYKDGQYLLGLLGLAHKCLAIDPAQRCTADEALAMMDIM